MRAPARIDVASDFSLTMKDSGEVARGTLSVVRAGLK
jgi:hypothetical protein